MRKIQQESYISDKNYEKRSYTMNKVTRIQRPLKQTQQLFKYFVGGGNNSSLVRRVLSTRRAWVEIKDRQYLFLNFKWQQSNRGYKYDNCVDNNIFRHSLNHLQFHNQLSNKQFLFRNLIDYCENNKMNVFKFIPLTFVINLTESCSENNLLTFLQFYESKLPLKMKQNYCKKNLNIPRRKSNTQTVDKRIYYIHNNLEINESFEAQNSKYLWILKPTSYNQGNGVHIFNELFSLEKLIQKYLNGYQPKKQNFINYNISPQCKGKAFRIKENVNRFEVKSTSFVIQKYMESPLLIDGRKFDIRVWVLITHEFKVYFFKQGYIRTSSFKYEIDQNKIDDPNMHLTNNSVQKNNGNYGRFEEANQLSFTRLKKLVEEEGKCYETLLKQIKNIIRWSVLSVRRKINKLERVWCFEILGYDFMLDNKCQPYLIEVNTNPCLEQSSHLLQQLLPRMLDDAFCLTLDRIFMTSKSYYNYVLPNQNNQKNLWELIVQLKKN